MEKRILNRNNGFTLVEMAMVIVVIGLIAGGIVAARSIIKSTTIISIANQVEEYKSAIQLFKDKYKSKPGDMSDAFDYFGATCGTDTENFTAGCNGDDDGLMEYSNGERLKAWRHLQMAGFVGGSFTGFPVNGTTVYGRIGVNVPGSSIDNVGYMFDYSLNSPEDGFLPEKDYLLLGAEDTTGVFEEPSVDPVFAQAIDAKTDDGYAYTGMTMSLNGDGATGCITNPGVITGTYNLSTEDTVCIMNFYFYDITD